MHYVYCCSTSRRHTEDCYHSSVRRPVQIHHQPLHIHSTASFAHSISLLSNLSTRRRHHWHPPAHPSPTSLTSDSCARCRVPRCRELHDLAIGKARQGSVVETRNCGVAVISTAMLGLGERDPWSSSFPAAALGLETFRYHAAV
jgi:hypothetical protein